VDHAFCECVMDVLCGYFDEYVIDVFLFGIELLFRWCLYFECVVGCKVVL